MGIEGREGDSIYPLKVSGSVSVIALDVVVEESERNVHKDDPRHTVDGDDDGSCLGWED